MAGRPLPIEIIDRIRELHFADYTDSAIGRMLPDKIRTAASIWQQRKKHNISCPHLIALRIWTRKSPLYYDNTELSQKISLIERDGVTIKLCPPAWASGITPGYTASRHPRHRVME